MIHYENADSIYLNVPIYTYDKLPKTKSSAPYRRAMWRLLSGGAPLNPRKFDGFRPYLTPLWFWL